MDNRAKIGYVDVVMALATLVALSTVAPWLYNLINSAQSVVDPLTGTLLALVVPLMFISLIISMGVSARQ